MFADTLRDTFFGQLIYLSSGKKVLQYPEDKSDFVVPERFQKGYKERSQGEKGKRTTTPQTGSPVDESTQKNAENELTQDHAESTQKNAENEFTQDHAERPKPVTQPSTASGATVFYDAHHDERSLRDAEGVSAPLRASSLKRQPDRVNSDSNSSSDATLDGQRQGDARGKDVEKESSPVSEEEQTEEEDPYLVDWYGPDDPANPINWSLPKKAFVVFLICFLTFSVYMGSSIVTPGEEQFAAEHGIGLVVATLSLTLFVVGYSVGPMVLAPLSEIPSVGRNIPYIGTLAVFVALQAPNAVTDSLAGYFILRFLSGVFGSPPLATGGATIGDLFTERNRALWMGVYGISCVCGPSFGPLIGGAAYDALGWRWTIWPLLFASGAALILLIFTLPETSSTNILLRRARRLRKLTGNDELYSAGEKMQANMTGKEIVMMTLVRPFSLTIFEPMVLLNNLEIGLVYAILYVWLEAFPIVFMEDYGFNALENGLALLSLFVGAIVTFLGFIVYCKVRWEPLFDRKKGKVDPEDRLEPSFFGMWWLPICLFGFGWTASAAHVHWIVPMIFASFFSIGTFLAFQSVLNYLATSFPMYIASVLASNDLFRGMMGAGFPLFARAMFTNLQANGPSDFPVAWGCTLLGCITLLFVPLPFIFHRYGPELRKRSKHASY